MDSKDNKNRTRVVEAINKNKVSMKIKYIKH
jgi:hypothetical protein